MHAILRKRCHNCISFHISWAFSTISIFYCTLQAFLSSRENVTIFFARNSSDNQQFRRREGCNKMCSFSLSRESTKTVEKIGGKLDCKRILSALHLGMYFLLNILKMQLCKGGKMKGFRTIFVFLSETKWQRGRTKFWILWSCLVEIVSLNSSELKTRSWFLTRCFE